MKSIAAICLVGQIAHEDLIGKPVTSIGRTLGHVTRVWDEDGWTMIEMRDDDDDD